MYIYIGNQIDRTNQTITINYMYSMNVGIDKLVANARWCVVIDNQILFQVVIRCLALIDTHTKYSLEGYTVTPVDHDQYMHKCV